MDFSAWKPGTCSKRYLLTHRQRTSKSPQGRGFPGTGAGLHRGMCKDLGNRAALPLRYTHLSLSTSLLSHIRRSWIVLYIPCPNLGICHFFKTLFPLGGVFSNHNLGAWCALCRLKCYCSQAFSSSRQSWTTCMDIIHV